MSWFSKIVGWFAGDGKTATAVTEIADEAFHTEQEKAIEDGKDLASARAMQLAGHNTFFDVIVDGASRMVRPGVTLWLIGGFIGWWPLPKHDDLSEFWQNVFMLIITFWFGGRAILRDLPQAIRLMRGLK